jgi:hypothetical protein
LCPFSSSKVRVCSKRAREDGKISQINSLSKQNNPKPKRMNTTNLLQVTRKAHQTAIQQDNKMNSSNLDHAAEWNNQGALQLAAGNLDEAYASFGTAMTLLGEGNVAQPSGYESYLPETSTVTFLLKPIEVAAHVRVGPNAEERDSFVYTKALTIQNSSRQYRANDVFLLRAVVKFNIGLGCHLTAYHGGDEQGIRKAFRFYHAGLQNLKDFPDQNETRSQEYATMLAVACMNNMAQVLFECNQVEKAAVLMKSVRTLLSTLDDIHVTFDISSLESIMLNEFFFSFTSSLVRGAPAA